MTPALTKVLKDGHGIHSCLSSVPTGSEGTAACCSETMPRMKSVGDDDGDDDDRLQELWPLLSSFPPRSSCLPMDVPTASVFSLNQDQVALLPCSSPLPGLLSVGEDATRSQQGTSVFPGGSDTFERDCQGACALYGRGPPHEHGPGGGDVPHTPLLDVAPSVYSQAETKQQGCSPLVPAWMQEDAGPTGCLSPPAQPPFCSRSTSDPPGVMLADALRLRLSRQAELQSKARRQRRRLQVLLGEHASRHCSQQLDGLKRRLDIPGSIRHPARPGTLPRRAAGPRLGSPAGLAELRDFCQSNRAVLRNLQGALDSEATLSSSSDEEQQEGHGRSGDLGGSWERRRLEERTELGSRWSWLQVRLADLEERTQQMGELHKHIRSTKGKVVLAESQPLTDTQIQQTLLREMAGLSCTAMDTDNEPCSPTRLLYNIERQSAQLSQFVNSLMPPLSFSPVKQPQSCTRQRAFLSAQTNGAFLPRSSNRRRLLSNGTCKAEMSCVCARTRPLVSFHKPRLFTIDSSGPTCPQDSGRSASPLSSPRSSSPSLRGSSSGAAAPLCDPECTPSSSSSSGSSGSNSLTPRTSRLWFGDAVRMQVVTRSIFSETAVANRGREEWSLRPLMDHIQPRRAAEHTRCSSTPVHTSHKSCNRHRRRPNNRVLDLSPIEAPGSSIQSGNRRANQKKRKRRHVHRPVDGEEGILYQLGDTEDSSDEFPEQRYKVPSRQPPQGFVGKCPGDSFYNINNIVIHTLVSKMEKLQYKDIMTPSWRLTDPSPLIHKKLEDEEGQEEDLADKVFALRHLALEHREKSRWASWGTRKCRRRPKRCGSGSFGYGGGMLTSGEESSAEWRWAQLDSDEEEWLPQSPWERRMFPLNEDEEKALFWDKSVDKTPLSVYGSTAPTPKNTNSQLSPAHLTGASPPPGGQHRNS